MPSYLSQYTIGSVYSIRREQVDTWIHVVHNSLKVKVISLLFLGSKKYFYVLVDLVQNSYQFEKILTISENLKKRKVLTL